MNSLVLDASVLVAAADRSDVFHEPSRELLRRIIADGVTVILPAIAELETAAALGRRLGDGRKALALTRRLVTILRSRIVAIDAPLLQIALQEAAHHSLRGYDALYAAAALKHRAQLVAWDRELIERAGATRPTEWNTR